MAKRVYVSTADLMFRSKLGAVIAAAGAAVTRDEAACDLAVVELRDGAALERVRALAARGIAVLAFGSHVDVAVLRAAREAGAEAVANSQVEMRLRAML